jgi:carbamoyltransferase
MRRLAAWTSVAYARWPVGIRGERHPLLADGRERHVRKWPQRLETRSRAKDGLPAAGPRTVRPFTAPLDLVLALSARFARLHPDPSPIHAGILDVNAPRSCIALAGGIFNNVRLNQRIRELPGVEDVYVFPNMGDGGLSVGAAWLAHVHATSDRPEAPPHMYLGPDASDAEIADALAASGLPHAHCLDINGRVGSLLADGHVVARFGGAMEFGPRALGNRSVLGPAVDPGINEWLNQRLHRSEFMPFAPATLADAADSCYIGLASGRVPAHYMTMTFSCTDLMRQQAPAAVQLDGTARPQIVSREDNPEFHRILERYRQLTGRSSVINTSFNMHEEPIVCSIDDALRAFTASQLPYLAAGPFLVTGDRELLT